VTSCRAWKGILLGAFIGTALSLAGVFASLALKKPYLPQCSAVFLACGIFLPLAGAMYQGACQQLIASQLRPTREVGRLLRKGRKYQMVSSLSVTVCGGLIVAAAITETFGMFATAIGGAMLLSPVAALAAFGPDVAGELAALQSGTSRSVR
jgi:hypothetical protein